MSGRHAASPSGDPAPAEASAPPTISVVSGDPSPEELAAVTAVLAALEAERAAEDAAQKAPEPVSGWELSRRGLRTTITVGPGQWGRHAG